MSEELLKLKAIEKEVGAVSRCVERMERRLLGDGTADNRGIVTEVELLKEANQRRTWRERTYVGAILAVAAKAFWDLVPGVR